MRQAERVRRLLLPLSLVTGAASACSSPPTDADPARFCTVYSSLYTGLSEQVQAPDRELVRVIRRWGEQMAATGTPSDIPGDARRGFELRVENATGLDVDADPDQLGEVDQDLDRDDQEALSAFEVYALRTCDDEGES